MTFCRKPLSSLESLLFLSRIWRNEVLQIKEWRREQRRRPTAIDECLVNLFNGLMSYHYVLREVGVPSLGLFRAVRDGYPVGNLHSKGVIPHDSLPLRLM